jgi:hypothetical protein
MKAEKYLRTEKISFLKGLREILLFVSEEILWTFLKESYNCFATLRSFPRINAWQCRPRMVYFLPPHGILFLCFIQLHEQSTFGRNPVTPCAVKEQKHTYLENQCLAHGGKFSSTQVPCLKPTAPILIFQTPLIPPTPLALTILQRPHQQFCFLDPEQ